MQYHLVYSRKRKTLAIQIKQGQVIVRAPYYIDKAYIERFLQTKQYWIEQKLALFKQTQSEGLTAARDYQAGQTLFFAGAPKTLNLQIDDNVDENSNIKIEQHLLTVSLPPSLISSTSFISVNQQQVAEPIHQKPQKQQQQYIRDCLINFYTDIVKQHLQCHLSLIAAQIGVEPSRYKVRLYKSRWGSCNNRRELTFNALLAMAPSSVLDYVIVHELCHIKFMNHSPQFWQLVAKHNPNYQAAKLWLKANSKHLQLPEIIY